jgi:hypothetical protein
MGYGISMKNWEAGKWLGGLNPSFPSRNRECSPYFDLDVNHVKIQAQPFWSHLVLSRSWNRVYPKKGFSYVNNDEWWDVVVLNNENLPLLHLQSWLYLKAWTILGLDPFRCETWGFSTFTCICIYAACLYVYIYICIYIYLCVYMYVYMYIYICTSSCFVTTHKPEIRFHLQQNYEQSLHTSWGRDPMI